VRRLSRRIPLCWQVSPLHLRFSPRARARAPTIGIDEMGENARSPLALARGPQPCAAVPVDSSLLAGFPTTLAIFPSRSREGPNRALRAAAHKPDSRSANPRGMRGNSGSREPAQKGSPRPRPGGNPWDERPEENRVSPRASAGGNPRARGEFAHPRASGFSRGGGNGLKGLTIVYAAR
jgi:hypothetical protein